MGIHRRIIGVCVRVLAICGILLSPVVAFADASTPVWDFYQYPDQFTPNTTIQTILRFKNTTANDIDAVTFELQLNTTVQITADTATKDGGATSISHSYLSPNGNRVDYGNYTNKLGLKSGEILEVDLNINIGGAATLPTVGQWVITSYRWSNNGNTVTTYSPTGNKTTTITDTPNPTQQPLNWGIKNTYSEGLTKSGLGDPLIVEGLLPPGPIDSIIVLPVTLAQQLLSVMNGSYVAPTITLYGASQTLPNGSLMYNALGTVFTGLATTAASLALLLPWLRSIYVRLQNATSLESDHNEAWGRLG